jgi:hypothetical protein
LSMPPLIPNPSSLDGAASPPLRGYPETNV